MSHIKEFFGDSLVNAAGESVSTDTLNDKIIAIYFSAHWCPPCRGFTPKLVEFYNEAKKEGKALEIVFASSDSDEKSMFSYMTGDKMPWLAVPHGDPRIDKLSEKFGIAGIPTLVV
eukprot:TRINITY_DN1601_c0_g1_i2.p1 TRINITY_DN1601_c0_g1~~TRINITY_DN1601_c0_g1_i2.p1  ORF type:complete len:116 (+),score=28.77 TRINITY_DN1601_c0_g1_i2:91-438(+)